MKNNNYLTVLKKELKDMFRDKKSMIMVVIIPLLLYPIMMFFIGGGVVNMTSVNKDIYIAVTGEYENGNYLNLFENDKKVIESLVENYNNAQTTTTIHIKQLDNVNKALIDGDIQTILTVEKGIENIYENNNTYKIGYVVDNRASKSSLSMSFMQGIINGFADSIFQARLQKELGENHQELQGVAFGDVLDIDNLYQRTGTSNPLIIMLIPILITVLISVGGATVAIDLTAGEKERGTFEPLLSTSANRFSIMSAKYTVVLILALIIGIVQILSMALGILLSPSMASDMAGGNLTLSSGGIILGAINIILLACVFCSIMLCVASTAKSFKEASTKTSFLIFLPIMLSYSIMFTDAVNIGITNMFIPIINVVSVVKMILSGYINYGYFLVSVGVNLVLLIGAIYLTLKTFSKESLISRS